MAVHPARTVAICVLSLLAVAVGCGQDDPDTRADGSTTKATVGGRSAYEALIDAGVQPAAATRGWLVGFDAGDWDQLDREPRYVTAPLAGGAAKALGVALGDGRRFSPATAMADDEDVVFVGLACEGARTEPMTEDARFCKQGTPTAFRVDPATGVSEELEVDSALADLKGLTLTGVQRTEDGWRLTGMRWLVVPPPPPAPSGGGQAELAVVDVIGDRMVLRRTWNGVNAPNCTTDDAVYLLTREIPESPSGGYDLAEKTKATFGIWRVPISGGEPEALEVPDLPGEFGGAMVDIGCLPEGPVVASVRLLPADAPAGPGSTTTSTTVGFDPVPRPVEAHAVQWVDGAWRVRSDLVPVGARSIGQIVSDRSGLLIGWSSQPPGRSPTPMTVFAPADGRTRQLDAVLGDWWWGDEDVRLGAVRLLGEGADLPGGRFPGLYEVDLRS